MIYRIKQLLRKNCPLIKQMKFQFVQLGSYLTLSTISMLTHNWKMLAFYSFVFGLIQMYFSFKIFYLNRKLMRTLKQTAKLLSHVADNHLNRVRS